MPPDSGGVDNSDVSASCGDGSPRETPPATSPPPADVVTVDSADEDLACIDGEHDSVSTALVVYRPTSRPRTVIATSGAIQSPFAVRSPSGLKPLYEQYSRLDG